MTQTALKPQDSALNLISTNPAKGYEVLGEVRISTEDEIKEKVNKARAAQKGWYDIGVEARVAHLRKLNDLFKVNRDEFVRLTSEEMGMPRGLSEGVVNRCIEKIKWNCDHAAACLEPLILHEDNESITTQYFEPRGVMACIVAWNFPLANFGVSAVQPLLAGNTVVMKYSEEVPLFAEFLESVIAQSGLPDGVVNFVHGDGKTGETLLMQEIDFISFTGSSQTGRKIYASAAERLLPVTLELGGSSPGIVFSDCKINDSLIETIFWKRFLNSAQFCNGLKRLIVNNSLLDECVDKLATYAKGRALGDPLDSATEMGPLVAERQVVKLEEQVKDALDKGAKLHCGGKRPDGLSGAYYEPTILTNVTRDMRIWREEVFGPALPVIGFDTYEEALELANDTDYGLSGSVFTHDKELELRAMLDIKAGAIDALGSNYFQPQSPFGGYKHSGIGRQSGKPGFHQACEIKVIARRK